QLEPKLDAASLGALRERLDTVQASAALVDYLQALLSASRRHARIRVGLSPRAGLALLRAARAWAMLEDRHHCLPEDVQAVFAAVAAHRLVPSADAGLDRDALARQILDTVPVD
ncbi:MAG TPA: AAA family ATPase, partial [Candidatus Saccharimonadia bacterium]|nr:AAA family ATPase [Candidatus Saccharimonadia bacterium]